MLDKTVDGKYTLIGLEEKGDAFQAHLAHYHLLGTQVMVDLIYPGRLKEGAAPLAAGLDRLLTLRHPCISRIFAWGEEEDYIFVVRDFTHGCLLYELLQESGGLPSGQSLELLRRLVEGLGALHGRGIYFTGLNPHQVWLDRKGEARIIRPGYSFLLEREDQRFSREAAPCWAPEVISGGEGTRASDVFSLGMMARQAFSSQRDNEGLWRVLREAGAHDPARRPSSARIFLERVEGAMSSPEPGCPERERDKANGKARDGERMPSPPGAMPDEEPAAPSPQERLRKLVQSQPAAGVEPPSGRKGGAKRPLKLGLMGAAAVLAAVLVLHFAGSASRAPEPVAASGPAAVAAEVRPEPQLFMPDLRGMDSIQARRFLQEMGLEVEVVSEPSNVVPEGKVIIQEPLKGEPLRKGCKVKVYVSKGPLQREAAGQLRQLLVLKEAISERDLVPGRGSTGWEPCGSCDPEELMTAYPEFWDHEA